VKQLVLFVIFFFSIFTQNSKQLVSDFYDAFNAHDVPKMMSFVSDSIHYFYIDGNKLIPDITTKSDLADSMRSYFKSNKTRSVIEELMVSGSFISIRERVFWKSAGKEKSQFALGIYQIHLGKIQRVWYYPAEK
jgi:hypothetical protein